MTKGRLLSSAAAFLADPEDDDRPSQPARKLARREDDGGRRRQERQEDHRESVRRTRPKGGHRHDDEDDGSGPDELVPDPVVAREFSISLMALWRWSHDPDLEFPPVIQIRNRNYRSRRDVEAFKRRMIAQALRNCSAGETKRPRVRSRA